MDLAEITPMVLTFNEQVNIASTLNGLAWASQILVVDSFSTDQTVQIAESYPNVKIVQRQFSHFADQCNFGLSLVCTPWVLSLDADYKCDWEFADELLRLDGEAHGYEVDFVYGVYGKRLRATLYPPRTVLYRVIDAAYCRDGHAHRVLVNGEIRRLKARIFHDDHKPLSDWFQAQLRYGRSEATKLEEMDANSLDWKDRLRSDMVIAPPLTLIYCLIVKRLLLDGWPGIFYTLQRVFAELVLSLYLLDRKLR